MPDHYTCSKCGKVAKTKQALERHVAYHEDDRPFSCEICDQRFKNSDDRGKHYRRLRKDGKFHVACRSCHKHFKSEEFLNKHQNMLGCMEKESNNYSESSHKAQTSNDLDSLKQKQIKTIGKITSGYVKEDNIFCICKVCEMEFTGTSVLKTHYREFHNDTKRQVCIQCGQTLSSKDSLVRHYSIFHQTDCPFTCTLCDEKFKIKESLCRHIKFVHRDGGYPCEICGHVFSQPINLKKHLAVHSMKKDYSCGICGKEFRWKQALHKHAVLHSFPKSCVNNRKVIKTGSSGKCMKKTKRTNDVCAQQVTDIAHAQQLTDNACAQQVRDDLCVQQVIGKEKAPVDGYKNTADALRDKQKLFIDETEKKLDRHLSEMNDHCDEGSQEQLGEVNRKTGQSWEVHNTQEQSSESNRRIGLLSEDYNRHEQSSEAKKRQMHNDKLNWTVGQFGEINRKGHLCEEIWRQEKSGEVNTSVGQLGEVNRRNGQNGKVNKKLINEKFTIESNMKKSNTLTCLKGEDNMVSRVSISLSKYTDGLVIEQPVVEQETKNNKIDEKVYESYSDIRYRECFSPIVDAEGMSNVFSNRRLKHSEEMVGAKHDVCDPEFSDNSSDEQFTNMHFVKTKGHINNVVDRPNKLGNNRYDNPNEVNRLVEIHQLKDRTGEIDIKNKENPILGEAERSSAKQLYDLCANKVCESQCQSFQSLIQFQKILPNVTHQLMIDNNKSAEDSYQLKYKDNNIQKGFPKADQSKKFSNDGKTVTSLPVSTARTESRLIFKPSSIQKIMEKSPSPVLDSCSASGLSAHKLNMNSGDNLSSKSMVDIVSSGHVSQHAIPITVPSVNVRVSLNNPFIIPKASTNLLVALSGKYNISKDEQHNANASRQGNSSTKSLHTTPIIPSGKFSMVKHMLLLKNEENFDKTLFENPLYTSPPNVKDFEHMAERHKILDRTAESDVEKYDLSAKQNIPFHWLGLTIGNHSRPRSKLVSSTETQIVVTDEDKSDAEELFASATQNKDVQHNPVETLTTDSAILVNKRTSGHNEPMKTIEPHLLNKNDGSVEKSQCVNFDDLSLMHRNHSSQTVNVLQALYQSECYPKQASKGDKVAIVNGSENNTHFLNNNSILKCSAVPQNSVSHQMTKDCVKQLYSSDNENLKFTQHSEESHTVHFNQFDVQNVAAQDSSIKMRVPLCFQYYSESDSFKNCAQTGTLPKRSNMTTVLKRSMSEGLSFERIFLPWESEKNIFSSTMERKRAGCENIEVKMPSHAKRRISEEHLQPRWLQKSGAESIECNTEYSPPLTSNCHAQSHPNSFYLQNKCEPVSCSRSPNEHSADLRINMPMLQPSVNQKSETLVRNIDNLHLLNLQMKFPNQNPSQLSQVDTKKVNETAPPTSDFSYSSASCSQHILDLGFDSTSTVNEFSNENMSDKIVHQTTHAHFNETCRSNTLLSQSSLNVNTCPRQNIAHYDTVTNKNILATLQQTNKDISIVDILKYCGDKSKEYDNVDKLLDVYF